MDLFASLIIAALWAADPQPGLPTHERAEANVKLARQLREECTARADERRALGDMWEYYAWWGLVQDQDERVSVWWLVFHATDPDLPWLTRRWYYHELVDRIGERAVFSGEMIPPFGDWVPIAR